MPKPIKCSWEVTNRDRNLQKVLQETLLLLTYIACQNIWYNGLKENMSKHVTSGPGGTYKAVQAPVFLKQVLKRYTWWTIILIIITQLLWLLIQSSRIDLAMSDKVRSSIQYLAMFWTICREIDTLVVAMRVGWESLSHFNVRKVWK